MHLHPNALTEASYRQAHCFQARPKLEVPLRKSVLFATIFAFSLIASFASAQQGDAYFGFGTLTSPGAASCNFSGGCPEKGGLYPNVGADVIFHHRIGAAFDVAWRGGQGNYGGYPYRPILADFNAVYQPRLGKKIGLDLVGGVGWQSTRFYSSQYSCSFYSCTNYNSTDHFLVDVGGGLRYYVWGHFFVRPEARYYWVNNNTNEFTGNNLFRVGASIGYTLGPD
jgi:hypothetical protein